MDYKCASFLVLCALFAVCSAVTYQYLPGIEYGEKIYIPLSAIPNVRVPRAADPRHHGHSRDVAQSQANAAASSQADGFSFPEEGENFGHNYGEHNRHREHGEHNNGFARGPFGGGFGPNTGPIVGGFNNGPIPFGGNFGGGAQSSAGANVITGGFNGGQHSHGDGSQANADANAVAGNGVGYLPQGGSVPAAASAGASGGSSADANAQTQTFTGNGFSASSSSASSSSRSDGYVRGANSVANANAVAVR